MSTSDDTRGLRLTLFLARCLGVSPPRAQFKYLHLVWSCLLLSFITFYTVQRLITMKFQKKVLFIQKLFYFSEYPANILLTFIFSLSVYRNEGFYRRLWRQVNRLEKQLYETPEAVSQLYRGLSRNALKQLCAIICFHTACMLTDAAWLNFDLYLSLASNCAHQLPSTLISFSLLQYMLAHRIISQFYVQLRKRVAQLQPSTAAADTQLEQLRLACVGLDAVQAELINRFAFVLLIGFGNSLLSFSYEIFNAFRLLELAEWGDWLLYCYRSLWLLLHGSRTWFVLRANERITEQKCELSLQLNQLNANDMRLERTINRFLLGLQSKHAQPQAFCVELDTMALGGFINALLAIVIFLIQIDLGNKSLRGYV